VYYVERKNKNHINNKTREQLGENGHTLWKKEGNIMDNVS